MVPAPLIPDVAFVEFPPKNEFLSKRRTLPPLSNTVCAADNPERPPPTTITWGNDIFQMDQKSDNETK